MASKLSRWCDGLIEAGWLAAIIAIPLFFNIHSSRVFEPDKLTLLRSIALLMSAVWVVKVIDTEGWRDFSFLKWRNANSIWRMPFVLPVALLVLIYILSTIFSVTPRVSWAGSYQRLQGTYSTLSYIVIFALMAHTMRNQGQVRRVVTMMIVSSIPIAFYALLQGTGWDPLPWGGNVEARVAGHMGNSIFVAAYLIMVVPLTFARILDAFTNILQDEELSYADTVRSTIYILTFLIQLIAILWTQSRGPWFGLAVGMFAFILIILVSLRQSAPVEGAGVGDWFKPIGFVAVGIPLLFLLLHAIFKTLTIESLAGSKASFAAFGAAIVVSLLAMFALMAMQRGWRWLWASFLLTAFLVAGMIGLLNVPETTLVKYEETVLSSAITEVRGWKVEISGIRRLSRLLEDDKSTGRVRVLIWEGALELIKVHEPLKFPNGKEDNWNFLRPIIGYGPESMYVAYNRFYPPELATIEARNASPDRSHNETFDALVITGWGGFLVWQALYLSVFYYAFRWLGVVRHVRDRNLLFVLWIGGAILASVMITRLRAPVYVGVAIPFGSIGGLVLYLIYYALSVGPSGEDEKHNPFDAKRLMMVGLVAGIAGHYIEIHFGIAIAATRLYFFALLGLMFVSGYMLPKLGAAPVTETAAVAEAPEATRRKKRKGRSAPATRSTSTNSIFAQMPLWAYTMLLGLILGIIGFEFINFSLPPGQVIESIEQVPGAYEIWYQSFLINARKEFVAAPFIYMMIMMTWLLGTLLIVSELVKDGQLVPVFGERELTERKRQLVSMLFAALVVGAAILPFMPGVAPAVADVTATWLLARSLLILLGVTSLVAALLLYTNNEMGVGTATTISWTGLLFSLPILLASQTSFGRATAVALALVCGLIIYQLWDSSWSKFVRPVASMAGVSMLIAFAISFLQAFQIRASIIGPQARAAVPGVPPISLTALERQLGAADQVAGFLTLFYIFVIGLIFLASFSLGESGGRVRRSESSATIVALVLLLGFAFWGISATNMRVVHADIVYKRADPLDKRAAQLSRQQDSRAEAQQMWDMAIAVYEHALDKVPLEDFYYLFTGRAYLERAGISGEDAAVYLQTAEDQLLTAQNVNPLNTDHTANLARLHTRWASMVSGEERQEHLDLALNHYNDAVALSPQNAIIRNERARLHLGLLEDCEQAIVLYEESATVDPYYQETRFEMAEAYISCAADQEAEQRDSYYASAAEAITTGLELFDGKSNPNRRLQQLTALQTQYLDDFAPVADVYGMMAERDLRRFPAWQANFELARLYWSIEKDAEQALVLAGDALTQAPEDSKPQIESFINQLNQLNNDQGTTNATKEVLLQNRALAEIAPVQRNQILSEPPEMLIDPEGYYEAAFDTEFGEIRIRLFADLAPQTVNSFIYLAAQGFYDGLTFHRVIDGFMAQGGDPTGNGTGGPGYLFNDEVEAGLSFDRAGLLAMANAGPGTNGSQFFITFAETPWLDGRHTIFGEVIAGQEILGQLTRRQPGEDTPADLIKTIRIYTTE